MSDKQLGKFRTDDGSLYRVRWYGYGSGVAAVLETFDGTDWTQLERIDEGKGRPSGTEEQRILRKMKQKLRDVYGQAGIEQVEGEEWRRK